MKRKQLKQKDLNTDNIMKDFCKVSIKMFQHPYFGVYDFESRAYNIDINKSQHLFLWLPILIKNYSFWQIDS